MVLASEQLDVSLRIAAVTAPVAIYFLVLGLLNSRRTPQVLTGRQDFILMIAALLPAILLPGLEWAGLSLGWSVGVTAVLVAAIALVAPRGPNWVVYNLPLDQARDAVAETLRAMDLSFTRTEEGFSIDQPAAKVRLGGFALLRNVSIRLEGDHDLARRFETQFARTLGASSAQTTPMAMALLLVATGMLVTPLALLAHRVPEIVRILTDLLQ